MTDEQNQRAAELYRLAVGDTRPRSPLDAVDGLTSRAKRLLEAEGITTLDLLLKAVEDGKLVNMKGVGYTSCRCIAVALARRFTKPIQVEEKR